MKAFVQTHLRTGRPRRDDPGDPDDPGHDAGSPGDTSSPTGSDSSGNGGFVSPSPSPRNAADNTCIY